MKDFLNKVTLGDLLKILPLLPCKSIHCCVTSPPYWALRDYGDKVISSFPEIDFSLFGVSFHVGPWTGQIGHEPDPLMFVAHMVYIFRQVHRVLRDDGVLWINLGDSYSGSKKGTNKDGSHNPKMGDKQKSHVGTHSSLTLANSPFLKQKDLCGIPWMVAFALREDGWYLRQDIIWSKPNPMPESVSDRCTKSHEYVFLFSKSKNYHFDSESIKTPGKNPTDDIRRVEKATLNEKSTPTSSINGIRRKEKQRGHTKKHSGFNNYWDQLSSMDQSSMGANKRSVWEVAVKPFTGAHFATYPLDLIVDCIKAGCPDKVCSKCGSPIEPIYSKSLVPTSKASKREIVDDRDMLADRNDQGSNRQKDGHKHAHIYKSTLIGHKMTCKCDFNKPVPGVVLDPFSGSNTTGIVSRKLNRNYISVEINPDYEPIYNQRTHQELGLFQQ